MKWGRQVISFKQVIWKVIKASNLSWVIDLKSLELKRSEWRHFCTRLVADRAQQPASTLNNQWVHSTTSECTQQPASALDNQWARSVADRSTANERTQQPTSALSGWSLNSQWAHAQMTSLAPPQLHASRTTCTTVELE